MSKGQRRSQWRVHLSATDDKVRFSLQGHLGRRAAWTLVVLIALVLCALIAPEVVAEIARLLESISP
ncbi:MAG TPA: hypothetical protein VJ793_06705 [Anaerolineae bacterium]|nr:hypothetical protein [Anaerolineae bacterium]HKZ83332.1 hypothetical protein [Anaerolineae bacterium]